MAGYLLRKVKFEWSLCIQELMSSNNPNDEQIHISLEEKAYKEKGALVYPSNNYHKLSKQ